MITREKIAERRALLVREHDNLQSQLYGYEGAIQDCDYWTEQLEAAEKPQEDDGGADNG